MLTCNNVSISRNGRVILKNFSISLFPGSCLCVYGNNGTGKTSLLRVIASLLPTLTGEILYQGINVRDILKYSLNNIFYLGDYNSLDLELSVWENLKFWASIYNTTHSLAAAIAVFSLENYLDSKIYTLSCGWQRRIKLALLLLNHSKLWLLDEPFSNLDDIALSSLIDIFNVRTSQSGIIIFTTPVLHQLEVPYSSINKVSSSKNTINKINNLVILKVDEYK